MKRVLGSIGATVLLCGGGLLSTTSGCADNESSIYVRDVLAGDESCIFRADPESTFIGAGSLDVAIRGEYHAALLVGNQLVRRGDPEQLRTETSRVTLYAADVTLLSPGGGALVRADGSDAAFSVEVAGFVDPGTGQEPGYGIALVKLIDAQTAQDLAGQIMATGFVQDVVAGVIVRGRTTGGNELETAEFQFPISVCYGCLIVYPAEADDPGRPGVDCDIRADAEVSCRPGQDGPVDCRSCSHPLCSL